MITQTLAETRPRALLRDIHIRVDLDETADLNHLDQFKDSTDPEEMKYYAEDQKRKQDYLELNWYMVGITAVATIYIPFQVYTSKQDSETHFRMHRIDSDGLWGIESDSKPEYFKEVAAQEVDHLKNYLQILNVDIEQFEQLKIKALDNIKV